MLSLAFYWAESYALLAILIPLVLIVVLAVANFRMIVADASMLLTPLFGMRLIGMVVFGFGALIDAFAPANARLNMDLMYPTTAQDVAKVDLLWLFGMTILTGGVLLAMRFDRKLRVGARGGTALRSMPLELGMWMFVIASSLDTMRIILNLIVPGIFANMILAFQLCGLFLIAQHAGNSSKARIILGLAIAFLFMLSIQFTSKSLFLYPALIAVLGLLGDRVPWRRTLVGTLLISLRSLSSRRS